MLAISLVVLAYRQIYDYMSIDIRVTIEDLEVNWC